MEVRRFPRGQDAPSENPAGSADPVQRTGREGGVCFLCARFLCTSKERWLAPSRRETLRNRQRQMGTCCPGLARIPPPALTPSASPHAGKLTNSPLADTGP